jgi:hypothetical protein
MVKNDNGQTATDAQDKATCSMLIFIQC